jgi:hypothetical protein
MKIIRNLILASVFMVPFISMASPFMGVNVLTTSHDIFYFKVDQGWIGGEVEVIGENAIPVSVQKLDRKKMVVDFFDLAPGQYTIVIKKKGECDCHEEFIYIKK